MSFLNVDISTERREHRTPPTVTVTTASTPTKLPKDVLSYSNEILAYSNDDLSQTNSDPLRHNSSDVLRRENDALMESFLLRQSDSSSGLTSDCDQVFNLLNFFY